MMRNNNFFRVCLVAGLLLAGGRGRAQERMVLRDGWEMQSALVVPATGDAVSRAGYSAAGWYKVSVPTTIIAGLLANKVYDFDPF